MCESLALLATVGEIKPEQKEEKLLIEEDGTKPDKIKEQKKTDDASALAHFAKIMNGRYATDIFE